MLFVDSVNMRAIKIAQNQAVAVCRPSYTNEHGNSVTTIHDANSYVSTSCKFHAIP